MPCSACFLIAPRPPPRHGTAYSKLGPPWSIVKKVHHVLAHKLVWLWHVFNGGSLFHSDSSYQVDIKVAHTESRVVELFSFTFSAGHLQWKGGICRSVSCTRLCERGYSLTVDRGWVSCSQWRRSHTQRKASLKLCFVWGNGQTGFVAVCRRKDLLQIL